MMPVRNQAAALPASNRAVLQWRFWPSAPGLPLANLLLMVAATMWLTGGERMWREVSDIGIVLFWLGLLCLMDPALLRLSIFRSGLGARKLRA